MVDLRQGRTRVRKVLGHATSEHIESGKITKGDAIANSMSDVMAARGVAQHKGWDEFLRWYHAQHKLYTAYVTRVQTMMSAIM
eukprot:1990377-Alexandrium_andersonii.AAC.1